ncbi:nuclease-related domain-containing protein [Peribacillus kribbensis]|uniref:nuclease-related domain-containing protein n=1 Tax=Peribacillus kribbensis TaxID=356658 RepID=UPI000425E8A6|nr:nuclease-related domain-containing protein [Peribacillus kribbensis]
MPYKARTEPAEIVILNSLLPRMSLSDKYKQHYFNLKKGYEGEVQFDIFTEDLECDCLILNDLLLKQNSSLFQIDSLILTSETIYLLEVKNFEKDYYYESDRLYKTSKLEVTNPLTQLNRSESLMRRLLQQLGSSIPIAASVVFINPEFTLYQAPLNTPFILPTQIHRYLKNLKQIPSKLNATHLTLAEKLLSLHIKDSPFKQLPDYQYDQLQKGIPCVGCRSLSTFIDGKKCVCKKCGREEAAGDAIMRNVNEFRLLFPGERVTTSRMYEWCKVVESKKRIRRVLDKNFQSAGDRRWTFYY